MITRCAPVVGPFTSPDPGEGVVITFGSVPKTDIMGLVSACDIYAVTPKMTPFSNAQLPTKVFDGMAMKRAVMATRVSDLPLLLGKFGIFIKVDDPAGLRDAILSLAGDEKNRKKRGIMMRKTFLKNWSTEKMQTRMVPLIGSLLPDDRAPSCE